MSDPFLGEVRIFPFTFAPKGWAFCSGQLLPIDQNTALFSLLGTNFGGDGRVTFGLPNLQGNVPIHVGASSGPGLTQYNVGQTGGLASVTLVANQMPQHNHALQYHSIDPADTNVASSNASYAVSTGGALYQNKAPNAQLAASAIGNSGSGGPHNNMQPFLVFNFCIALAGIYPART